MKFLMKILSLFFLLAFGLTAQDYDKPKVSKGELLFYIDNASFLGTEGKTYTEFYLMLYADQLKLGKRKDNSNAVIELQAILRNNSNEIIDEKNWNTEVVFKNSADVRSLTVYDYWGMFISPGTYKFSLVVKDTEIEKSGTINTSLVIPLFDDSKLGVSQICFINGLKETDDKSNTRRNSIIPNPSRRFGILNPQLTFYYEIYSPLQSTDVVLGAEYQIKDAQGNVVKSINNIEINNLSGNKGRTQSINISKLLSGIYSFEILIKDSTGYELVSSNRNFEIIQLDYFNETIASQEKIEALENIFGYLATPQQMSIYEKLGITGQAQFLVRFFRDNDPSPETIENEYLQDLLMRYNTSNQNFGWGRVEGWKTERARVFIQFGKPDEIENHIFEEETRSYEVWYYRKEREIYFVFADMLSNGNYSLLHSNKEGEVYNPRWKELITKL